MTEQQQQIIGDGTLIIGDASKTDFMVKVRIHKHSENSQYLGMWMNLETVIQSEVRKRKANVGGLLNVYMWNLEKWYRLSYLKSRDRDTDVESKHTDIKY